MDAQLKMELLAQKRFELIADEKLIEEGFASYIKSTLNVVLCHVALTNHRIVICKKNMIGGMAIFGIAGAAISLARKQTKIMFQIPVADITGVRNAKHGFSRKYRFSTYSGETYDLVFTHPERWSTELKSLGIIIEE